VRTVKWRTGFALVFLLMSMLLMDTGLIATCRGFGDPSTFAVPYTSYTYDFWQEPVPAPQAYVPVRVLRGPDLGLGAFTNPSDIYVDSNHRVYIADTGNNRVIQLDRNFNVLNVFSGMFNAPSGICVTGDGQIYIADRNNSRIVVLDQNGALIRIIGKPEPEHSGVLRADFRYNPVRLGVDQVGRVFVISAETYDGIMEFDPDGNFRGFVGAPKVTPSFIDYVWRRFSSAERRKLLALFLPTQHSGIDIDERGFIYTTVSEGEIRYTEAIRRLNPAGTDVMRRAGFHPPIGDYGSALLDQYGESTLASSLLVDVIARENGIYSALDQRRGRVFTYDESGNLLYVFGGSGQNRGNFQLPVALAELDQMILILDRGTNMITVFEPTEYARKIHAAIAYYYDDDWDASVAAWQEVRKMNVNLDVAHTGIGRALLREGRYAEAMTSFRLGEDRINYSKAFSLYRREVIYDNFTIVAAILIAAPIVLFFLIKLRLVQRLRKALVRWEQSLKAAAQLPANPGSAQTAAAVDTQPKNPPLLLRPWLVRFLLAAFAVGRSLRYALYVIFHPADGFWDLKHEKRGSVASASILLGLLTLTYVFARQYTGFIFNPRDLIKLNIWVELASVLVPILLWCAVNWSLTTISEGKGSFREIYITVAYALTPMILINLPMTVISNYLTAEEGVLYFVITSMGTVWSGALVFIGTMQVHEYDFKKTLAFSFLTIVGMALTLFIALLFFNLAEQVYQFGQEVYMEVILRT